jgi:Flp pilus assembly protein protease CpaA
MLHWIYIVIASVLAALVGYELFTEERVRNKVSLALILIPLLLRILHVK